MSPFRLWHVWRLHSNEPVGSLLMLCAVQGRLEQIAQLRPRAIGRLDGAITVLLVEILAAPGADSAAVLSADGSYRHVHEDLLAHELVYVQNEVVHGRSIRLISVHGCDVRFGFSCRELFFYRDGDGALEGAQTTHAGEPEGRAQLSSEQQERSDVLHLELAYSRADAGKVLGLSDILRDGEAAARARRPCNVGEIDLQAFNPRRSLI